MGLGPISAAPPVYAIPQSVGLFHADGKDNSNIPGKDRSGGEWAAAAKDESETVDAAAKEDPLLAEDVIGEHWNNFSNLPANAGVVSSTARNLPLVSSPAVEFVATNSTAMGVATRVSDAFSAIGDFAGEHPAAAAVGTVALVAGVAAIGVAAGVISAPVAIGAGIFAGAAALFG